MRFLKKKNLMASIAQILLAVILLPGICIILNAIMPDYGGQMFLSIISELPVWGEAFGIIGQLMMNIQEGGNVVLLDFLNLLIDSVQVEILEATIMGMCIYACKSIGTLLYIRGVPVVQTLAGILLGTITVYSIKSSSPAIYMTVIFLFVLNVVLTLIEASGQWIKKALGIFLGMGLQSIIAGLTAGYVLVLAYLLLGGISDWNMAINLLCITLIPLISLMCLDYILFTPAKS